MRSTWSRVSAGFADASTPSTRRGRPPCSSSCANPATIPAWVDPVTEHTTTVSKKTPSSASCAATSCAQFANPSPPSGWSDAPAGIGYGFPPRASISRSAVSQLSLNPMPNPALTSRTSAPASREMRMLPTLSYTASGQSTQLSCTSTHFSPTCAATAATCRVWLLCTPPIETRVSRPWASASATRYSSWRVLLPPNAIPEFTSPRLAQAREPPRCAVSRSSRCTGDGPNSSGWRGKSDRLIGGLQFRQQRRPDLGGGGDGGVHVVVRAGGDQRGVQRDGLLAVCGREPLALQPPDRGGEAVDRGPHRAVAAARQQHVVQLVVRGQRAVQVTSLHGRREPLVGRAHRSDVVRGHRAGRLPDGELVHGPHDD